MTLNEFIYCEFKGLLVFYVFVFTSARLGSCSCDQSFRVIYIYISVICYSLEQSNKIDTPQC